MALKFATTLRTNRATQILNAIDAGNEAGIIEIYTAPQPATGAAITTQTKLGTMTFADPCGSVTAGVLTFDAITEDAAADADGTCTWARISSRNSGASTHVFDATVTATGAGGDFTLNTTDIVTGGPISVTGTPTITEGNA